MKKERLPERRERIWEIDATRGLIILGVLCLHLYWTVDAFCIDGYYNIDSYAYVELTDPLRFWFDWGEDGVIYKSFLPYRFGLMELWRDAGVDAFFVLSGISCMFTRDNLKRGLKLLAAGMAVAAYTKLLALYSGEPNQFIRFGVLHCYAYCHLIYYFLLEKKSDRGLLAVAAVACAIGYYLHYNPISTESALLYPFGFYEKGAPGSDYWPIFPMLGWMLLGVVIGRRLYSERKSRHPNNPLRKWTRPLQWMGKYSGILYLSHIVIYSVVFCGIGEIFGLL